MIDVSIYYYVYTYFCGEREREGGKITPVVPLCKHIRRTKGVTRIDFMENKVWISGDPTKAASSFVKKQQDGGVAQTKHVLQKAVKSLPMPSKQHGLIARLINHDLVQSFQPARSLVSLGFGMPECLTYTAKMCTQPLEIKNLPAGPQSPKEREFPIDPSIGPSRGASWVRHPALLR